MIFNQMKNLSSSLLDSIHRHPFNEELSQGTLPLEKFIFYLQQDSLYLADFSRALALTAARLSSNTATEHFLSLSLEAIRAEKALHANYITKYQSKSTDILPNPSCFMYTNYLLKMASLASVEEAAACLLPCFFIYQEVGKNMAVNLQHSNPYWDWISLYSGPSFEALVLAVIQIVEELALHSSESMKEKMVAAFLRSTQLEWLFWEAAYQGEQWKDQCYVSR